MALTTNQCGRLIGYTCAELAAYTWAGINSLPFGIKRAFAATENAAASRGDRLDKAQSAIEGIEIVSYSALETAINNLDAAADELLAAFD